MTLFLIAFVVAAIASAMLLVIQFFRHRKLGQTEALPGGRDSISRGATVSHE